MGVLVRLGCDILVVCVRVYAKGGTVYVRSAIGGRVHAHVHVRRVCTCVLARDRTVCVRSAIGGTVCMSLCEVELCIRVYARGRMVDAHVYE